MSITFATILWAIVGILSAFGFYILDNKKSMLINFITDRNHLLLLIFASLCGMRNNTAMAITFLTLAILIMFYNYVYHKKHYFYKEHKRSLHGK